MRRLRTRWGLAAAVAVITVVLTACVPIAHPTFTVVEPPDGAVRVVGLSGDGNFAVVSATGAGATVPSAGLWRVDRRDDTSVVLPAGSTYVSISNDGQRILFTIGLQYRIWQDGTVIILPAGTHMNKDLTWGTYRAFLGFGMRRWETATQAITSPETGFPRPAGEPNVTAGSWGISLDGTVVWFGLDGPGGCITRFIDLAASHVDDEPACGVTVSANGAAYLVESAPYTVDTLDGSFGGPTRVDLVHRVPHVAVATLTAEQQYLADIAIADTGAVFWAIDTSVTGTFPTQDDPCGTPTSGPCTGQVDSVTAFAVARGARQRFAVEAGESSILGEPERSSISSDGRFLTYVGSGPTHALHVLDRYFRSDEVLSGHATLPSNDASECSTIGQPAPCTMPIPAGTPSISADGRVIVAAPERANGAFTEGWYEYLADQSAVRNAVERG
jgi:hypothetical protein